ncbi:Dimethylaniline monooxygenase [N-oxide-forming] 5 [Acipenser ruthenus]|uniref:Flavin-containing monooxygenase n=1 Tax=Acipenser ruthenus TaxID=7906 RepID=A0A444V4K7_ACIRT|nr:Dimethylaniline monooxygenase [N-oxide-forming] 5 [Acipenser ruthenus]
MGRRIAVIGAGATGLTCIKSCLDERLEPVCFERSKDIGGLWRFKEEAEAERASIYHSVIINTSKEMMCYSDFPIPDHFPNYMHNSRILEYFRMYAQHFDLTRHVRFQTAVRSVKKRPDFSRSGQWEVVSVSSAGQEQSETFDGVMVCTGHHTHPHMPLHDFPGRDSHTSAVCKTGNIEGLNWTLGYVMSQRHTIQVDYIPYMDELAAQLGVRPRLGWLLLRDPRLGLQLLLGPCTPYQYRLCGPGQWAGARRAILTQWDRVTKPLRTRVLPETPRPSTVPLLLKLGSEMGRRIAVIGAGATGLTCIKSCLDEGLEPVCFERSKDIGGLWRFKEEAEAERASIYHSVIINTSKEMMCYSDFPIPDHFPNYMHNSRILEYFRMYAQHFDLTRHVRFQTAVRSVKKRPDFSRSGQWEVVSVSSAGQEQSETFDGVMVCTGHHTHPHMPLHDFPGRDSHTSAVCKTGNIEGLNWTLGLFSQHPMVNDDLPNRILSGRVQVKPNVSEFRSASVVFQDGSVEDRIDVVVFATGYTFSFPFLDDSVLAVADNQVSLYKYVFPPALERPTLAVIGLIQPLGAIMPISELQARWATRVFAELQKLPPEKTMLKDIENKKKAMAKRYVLSQRHTIQVDYIPYMDELAAQLGVRPRLGWLLLRDMRLGLQLLLGPCTPYQYRLCGPGQWAGARRAILTQWDRVAKPLRTRVLPETPRPSTMPVLLKLSAACLLCTAASLYIHRYPPLFIQNPPPFIQRFVPNLG